MEIYMNQMLITLGQLYHQYMLWFYLIPYSILIYFGISGKIVVYKNFCETVSSPLWFTASIIFAYVVCNIYFNKMAGPHNHETAVRVVSWIPFFILMIRDILITFRNNGNHFIKSIMAVCLRLTLSVILGAWIALALITKSTMKDNPDMGILKIIPAIAIFIMILVTRDKDLGEGSRKIVNAIYKKITDNDGDFAGKIA